MFANKDVKIVWCAKGGENANTTFEFLDYELIEQNPKIICGYSDITSISNVIAQKTGIVTYSSTNFKTIATDETMYSYKKAIETFEGKSIELGELDNEYDVLNSGTAKGQLIGGNLSLIKGLIDGKYRVDFENKILFIEELGYETSPALASNYLHYMKQNGIFEKIAGLWIGNYEHQSGIALEKIVLDTLGENIKIPIIKSNNFGHIEEKIVVPIGIRASIDTNSKQLIKLEEKFVN